MGSVDIMGCAAEEKTQPQPWWESVDLRNKCKLIIKNITIEPMVGAYIVGSIVSSLATQNLNLRKACFVNLNFSQEVCDALDRREVKNYEREELQVQELVAGMTVWKTIIQGSIPAVLIIFIGSWSDRVGCRKPVMLLPILGEFIMIIGLMLCTYNLYWPIETAIFTEAFFPAITGGWMTMLMGAFSYISDITDIKSRTFRIAVLNVFCSVGVPIGIALSGILYRQLGAFGVYMISALLYMFCFVYGKFAVRESPKKSAKRVSSKKKSSCLTFFNISHIKEAFVVSFRQGHSNRRLKIGLLMIIFIVIMGPMHGEISVVYNFTRVRFRWSEIDYSIYSAYTTTTSLVGTLFAVFVFSQLLQMDDALVGCLACISKILASFVYAFATTEFFFYLGPLVEIINGMSFVSMRSIASKLIPQDELGKVNSLYGFVEAIVPLIYGPLYSFVYKYTLTTLPGAFFLVGSALTVPAAVIFWWLYALNRNAIKDEEAEVRDNEKSKDQISTISSTVQNQNNFNLSNGTTKRVMPTSTESNYWKSIKLDGTYKQYEFEKDVCLYT